MCGLVGVLGTINHKEKQAFKWLLHFDATRGEHSTGVLAISPDDEAHVFKELGVAAHLYTKYPQNFVKGVYDKPAKLLMGHNRFATQGEIVAENAHPFEFEHVIGAHNGTVAEWSTRNLHNAGAFVIDSQKIYSQLNHNPEVQALWDHLEDTPHSAAALTFWDKRDQSLNIIRNSQRPLYVVLSKDTKTMFWASEQWMLTVACNQAGVPIQVPEAIEVNNHYKLFMKDGKLVLSKKAVSPKKPYVYPVVSSNLGKVGSNWNKRFLDLRIDHIAKDGVLHPYVAMTDITSNPNREVICMPPEVEQDNVFHLIQEFAALHRKIYEGEPSFRMDEEWLFSASDQKTLRLGAYRLIRELKDEMDILRWELENNRGEEAQGIPEHSVAEDPSGNEISGRALKRALKAANNCCIMCGTSNLKKGDINTVHGGVFLNEKSFVCGECVADDLVNKIVYQH